MVNERRHGICPTFRMLYFFKRAREAMKKRYIRNMWYRTCGTQGKIVKLYGLKKGVGNERKRRRTDGR